MMPTIRTTHGRPFVVLDRDGTLIKEHNYLAEPERVQLLPDTASALRSMQALGFGLLIATNQSGVGRGYFSEQTLAAIHQRLESLLLQESVTVDAIYVCPHTPEDECDCRKPRPGMIKRAGRELGLDPVQSFVVGDNWADIKLGKAVGATTVLVKTGYGRTVLAEGTARPDFVAANIADAARIIERVAKGRTLTAHG